MLPATQAWDSGLRAALAAPPGGALDIRAEFLSGADGRGESSDLLEYLRRKYEGEHVALVVPVTGLSYAFLARHRREIFGQAPAVFCCVDRAALARWGRLEESTGTILDVEIDGSLRLARRLQPGLRRLVVIVGGGEAVRPWSDALQQAAAGIALAPEVEVWVGRPVAEMMAELRRAAPDTAVLFCEYSADQRGAGYVPAEVCARLCGVSAVPVYGMFKAMLGTGIVGGSLVDLQQQGRAAGELAARVLGGEDADRMPPVTATAGPPIADWIALARWHLPEGGLPPEAAVINRPPGLLQRDRSLVLAAGSLVLLQAGLISVLLWERRRRHRAELERRRTEDWLTLAAESVDLGVWRLDAHSGRLYGNEKCFRLLGVPPDREFTLGSKLQAVHPEDRELVRQASEALRDEGRRFAIEYRALHRGAQVRWVAETAQLRLVPGEPQPVLLGVSVDITERVVAEQRARRLREEVTRLTRRSALGEMAAVLAHELNQPLGAIQSNADAALMLLQRSDGAGGDLEEILADIRSQDQRASAIIQRIRSLFQRGAGEFSATSLNEVAREAAALLRGESTERHIEVRLELAQDLPIVQADGVQIRQVILNLILNAFEAFSEGDRLNRPCRVILRTRTADEDWVEVSIEDNGRGIPAGDLERVFQPFFSTKESGMGLGLAICRTILESHRGRIQAENLRAGGAAFRFILPRNASQATHA